MPSATATRSTPCCAASAASSDGKGKGITAPNPVGQKLAVERAWQNAGLSPATATLIEGHGTSTAVGDVVEAQSMADVLSRFNLPVGSVALGSVKSNIGHLKGAAGAAGLLKVALALRDKVLPPSANCQHPNPDIDFAHSPLYVNTELKPWQVPAGAVRRAGLSAFGFGGTNFHAVLEEYIPHRLTGGNGKRSVAVSGRSAVSRAAERSHGCAGAPGRQPENTIARRSGNRRPLRGCTGRPFARCAEVRRSRPRPSAGRPGRIGPARARAPGNRLTAMPPNWRTKLPRRSRPWRPISRRYGRLCAPKVSSAVRACAQSRIPLHRARLAVREHAASTPRCRTDRGGNLCRSGPRIDPATGQAAQRIHLR